MRCSNSFSKIAFVFLVIIMLIPVVLAVTEDEVDHAIDESNLLIQELINSALTVEELEDMEGFVKDVDEANSAVGIPTNLMKTLEEKKAELEGKDSDSDDKEKNSAKAPVWLSITVVTLIILALIFLLIYFMRKGKQAPAHPPSEDGDQSEQDAKGEELKLEGYEANLPKLWKIKEQLVKKNIAEARLFAEQAEKGIQKEDSYSITSAKDFGEFESAIREQKQIHNKHITYSANDIIKTFKKLRQEFSDVLDTNPTYDFESVFNIFTVHRAILLTRADGIRDKFLELLRKAHGK
ncbi:hypothetical protein HOK51_04015 [Candidatus Woesearchaeota archaeon]|jgi:hypothetical protein|nr:hypothetical protein [Candidatus Woesearchaeota archaeon]MBT7368352.1 hypothetical protein [Candidatus Woesearchaeota archaeon]